MSTPNSPFGTPQGGGFGQPAGGYGQASGGFGPQASPGFGQPQPGPFGQPSGGAFGTPDAGGRFGVPDPGGQPPAPFGGPVGPGQHAPLAPGAGPSRRKPSRTLVSLLIATPAALVVGGVIGFVIASIGIGTLPKGEVEAQVTAVLQSDFGLTELQGVTCPDRIENEQGDSFQCTFEYAGQQQSVTVTIGSTDGQLVVGSPSA